MVCIHTENQNQGDFYPFLLLEISVLHEVPLGHLRDGLTDVPGNTHSSTVESGPQITSLRRIRYTPDQPMSPSNYPGFKRFSEHHLSNEVTRTRPHGI